MSDVDADPTTPVLDVVELGLACCALEATAARCGRHGAPGDGTLSPEPPGAQETVLVVAGTITNTMASRIRDRYDALVGPVTVVAFGACATTGGPYWDSYAVTPGLDKVLPVDVVVPGCPPRPEALRAVLADVRPRR